jgi:hypothetical protein
LWRNRALTSISSAREFAQEGLLLQPHLNTALRAEVLYFTTRGIMFAAKEYAAKYKRSSTQTSKNPSQDLQVDSAAESVVDIIVLDNIMSDSLYSFENGISAPETNSIFRFSPSFASN